MMYSTGTGYALRSLAAMPGDGSYILSKDLARTLGLPGPYLGKVLKALAREGLLDSLRGPHGGYRLARAAQLITVSEVVGILNHVKSVSACWMGCVTCTSRDGFCMLQAAWSEAETRMGQLMSRVTIRDLQICAEPVRERPAQS